MSSHWSNYWQQGHLTSFGEDFKGNYQGVLRDIWQPLFSTLPEQFQMLDVATGNGAIPLLASETAEKQQRQGMIVGCDLATINETAIKGAHPESADLQLDSGIDCGQLPYDDERFDLVTSQFGIEYSDLNRSLAETARVLKPGGRLAFVAHHDDSLVLQRNKSLLTFLAKIAELDIFGLLDSIVDAMGDVRSKADLAKLSNNKTTEQLRNRLNEQLGTLQQLDQQAFADSNLLAYVLPLFKQLVMQPMAEKKQFIATARNELQTLEQRLRELTDAALTDRSLVKLMQGATTLGLSLTSLKTLHNEREQVLGWYVELAKPH